MKCKCGSEQHLGLRKYWVTTRDIRVPLFVGSLKCPVCMKFNDAPNSNFYLLHTVSVVKTYSEKVANGKSL